MIAESNIPRLLGEEVLRERGGSLSSKDLFTAMKMAGRSERDAAIASARRALDETRRQG